jgi:hypothetical protein
VAPEHLDQGLAHETGRGCGAQVGGDAKRIRALLAEQVSGFFQTTGDLLVDALHFVP